MYLRRRRSHVALQRQRLRPEDADPAPDPLGHRHRPVRRPDQGHLAEHPEHGDPPELVPHSGDDKGTPAQSTQEKIGPYELQDFNLYYITRYGLRPSKVAFLSHAAWHDKTLGDWPDAITADKRNEYDLATIKKWLRLFLCRFFQISQFKRSAIPNGPKVGSGGSLSPRGDWRAPSDSEAAAWLKELDDNVPDTLAPPPPRPNNGEPEIEQRCPSRVA